MSGTMNWFPTFSGGIVDLDDVAGSDFRIEDVAHALGLLCRFNGHVDQFYSVAEHCVVMSRMMPEKVALHALLHDAAEAYVGDLITPIKRHAPGVHEIELALRNGLYEALELELPDADEVAEIRRADLRMLVTERAQLYHRLPDRPWERCEKVEPFGVVLPLWPPRRAGSEYSTRFWTLVDRKPPVTMGEVEVDGVTLAGAAALLVRKCRAVIVCAQCRGIVRELEFHRYGWSWHELVYKRRGGDRNERVSAWEVHGRCRSCGLDDWCLIGDVEVAQSERVRTYEINKGGGS